MRPFLIYCSIAMLLASAMPGSASHAAEPDFFEGKRLTYIVATKPGGGYDRYARLIARYLPRYLGVKSVVIRNVPGASHLIGLQQLFAAIPNGLTLGTFNTGLLIGIEHAGLDYDLRRLSWIGKAAAEPRLFLVPTHSTLRSFQDLRTKTEPVLIATSGKLSASNLEMELIASAFDIRTRHVHGFLGPDMDLAIARGDVEGALVSLNSGSSLLANGQARALFYFGAGQVAPGVERLNTFARSKKERNALDKLDTLGVLGRLSAGPPDIPPGRLQELRKAYINALNDPDLLDEAKRMRLSIDPWDGERVHSAVVRFLGDY